MVQRQPIGRHRPSASIALAALAALGALAAACSGSADGQATAGADGGAAPVVSVDVAGDGWAADGGAADGSGVDAGASDSTAPLPPAPGPDPVPALLASMSTEDKIGQLLMPMVYGTGEQVTAEERQLNLAAHGHATPTEIVAAYRLGGVIYLNENVASAPQLRALSQRLQEVSLETSGIGLLVAIDQEGGRVSRLSDEVTSFPPASQLGVEPSRAREVGYVTGQQVQQQGINVVLAPVADVVPPGADSFIGDRSFGGDPAEVSAMVAAAVDGLQRSGVAAAVKHWPGHGATGVDSHERLPSVDVERSLWEERERPPFAAAIDEDVSIVLVGHLAMPGLDPSARPATVSPVLVNELLRGELGFDGVVMSDALNMGAVEGIARDELVVASVQAGIDVMLMPPSLEAASAGLRAAVDDGRIDAAMLDAAVGRVLRLKHHLGLLGDTASG